MNRYKVVKLRYLNEDGSFSRPQKFKRITKDNGLFTITSMDGKRKWDEVEGKRTFSPNFKKAPFIKKDSKVTFASEWKEIRVKLLTKKQVKDTLIEKYGRPRKIYEISTFDKEGKLVGDIEYAPYGIKGTSKRIEKSEILFTWEKGPTPTPKPSRKYSKAVLARDFGWSDMDIAKLKDRDYSSNEIDIVMTRLKIDKTEAVALLDKYKNYNNTINNSTERLAKVKADRDAYNKEKRNMGKYTHGRVKIKAKPGSRRYRKMVKTGIINTSLEKTQTVAYFRKLSKVKELRKQTIRQKKARLTKKERDNR